MKRKLDKIEELDEKEYSPENSESENLSEEERPQKKIKKNDGTSTSVASVATPSTPNKTNSSHITGGALGIVGGFLGAHAGLHLPQYYLGATYLGTLALPKVLLWSIPTGIGLGCTALPALYYGYKHWNQSTTPTQDAPTGTQNTEKSTVDIQKPKKKGKK